MDMGKGRLPANLPDGDWKYCEHSQDPGHLAAGGLAEFEFVSIWCMRNDENYCVRRVFTGERELDPSEYIDSGLAPICDRRTLDEKISASRSQSGPKQPGKTASGNTKA
ncbi:hypothetical protein [Burkholderia contaminans]|uniref:hypothetical protein n=1 Tax=Burkholderia contaminans TaxID=488447 RepID=UPI000F58A491|nr:hypothetical protein [Burkholderia contaminans]HEM7880113.1 hypothetical protein [Burkholderia contaminans]